MPGNAVLRPQEITRDRKVAILAHLHKARGNIPIWHLFADYAFTHQTKIKCLLCAGLISAGCCARLGCSAVTETGTVLALAEHTVCGDRSNDQVDK